MNKTGKVLDSAWNKSLTYNSQLKKISDDLDKISHDQDEKFTHIEENLTAILQKIDGSQ